MSGPQLLWVLVADRGLSLVVASGGSCSSSLQYLGLSQQRLVMLPSMSSKRADSEVVVHGLSCSGACGIFLDHSEEFSIL
ncbi:hypothetical protein JEQ12_015063 [Ovis aries]|uniref:Secreted protein n=1 Tax=Ovis aries TaxID=9940 RepID=A0A836A925_SHEEP|nr:hypothetical protein JEQ12_015063 [Ovis aries]